MNALSLLEIKKLLRSGMFTFPGGYPMFFVTSDGATLSFDSVREQWKNVCWDHIYQQSTGWNVVAVDINYENGELYCDHSGKRIESAYAEQD